jgi:hypothetical protein
LYYNVNNGYVKDVRFAYPFCECLDVTVYKPCGDDELCIRLPDIDGDDIYEGDIITTDGMNLKPIGSVEWYHSGFMIKTKEGYSTITNTVIYKIIGNIHEGVK